MRLVPPWFSLALRISLVQLLSFVDPQAPDVEDTNGTRYKWFDKNADARIDFSILGSPVPNLTCIHEKTKQKLLSCSNTQMQDILYNAENKTCKSQNGTYILSTRISQTEKVQLFISKVKSKTNILCRLVNSKGQQRNFRLFVNVKGLLNHIC
jgi:hypothetical protein